MESPGSFDDPGHHLDMHDLERREAALLRMNEEIDAEAREVLRAPSMPSTARTTGSAPPSRGPGGHTGRPSSAGGQGKRGSTATSRSSPPEALRHTARVRGSSGRTEAPIAPEAESPVLSQRVRDATRAASERSGRYSPARAQRAGPPSGPRTQAFAFGRGGGDEPLSARGDRRGSEGTRTSPPHQGGSEDGQDTHDGSPDALPSNIGAEATIRFQKAKLQALQEQLKEATVRHQQQQLDMADLRRQLKAEQDDKARVCKQVAHLQQASEREHRDRAEGESSSAGMQSKLSKMKRDLLAAQKAAKAADTDRKAMEVRLNRALEEAVKLRADLAKDRSSKKDQSNNARQDVARLEQAVRKLERQKAELLAGFRKQMKLIDVLKRQKVHLEAARLLQFTEEEFVKLLDWTP